MENDIFAAAAGGNLGLVQSQIGSGSVSVDSKDIYGRTALLHAAACGRVDVVNYLLANHAHVDSKSLQGATPLGLAAARGHSQVVKALLEHDANIEIKSTNVYN